MEDLLLRREADAIFVKEVLIGVGNYYKKLLVLRKRKKEKA